MPEQLDEDWLACSFPTLEALEATQRLPSLDLQPEPRSSSRYGGPLQPAGPPPVPSYSSAPHGVSEVPMPGSCQPLQLARLESSFAAAELPPLQLSALDFPADLAEPSTSSYPPPAGLDAADPIDTLLDMFMTDPMPAAPTMPRALPQLEQMQTGYQPSSLPAISTDSTGHLPVSSSDNGFHMFPATPQVWPQAD